MVIQTNLERAKCVTHLSHRAGFSLNSVFFIYLYMETFSMRSVVSVSVMMMPFGETVNVTLRNFLALALACEHKILKKHSYIKWRNHLATELTCHSDMNIR